MEPRELFKVGFLLRCAEEGLTPEQVQTRMEKAAVGTMYQAFVDALGLARGALTWPAIGALPLGFAGGAILADMTAPDAPSTEELKRQELLAAYRRATDRANRIAARTQYRLSQAKAAPRLPSTVLGAA